VVLLVNTYILSVSQYSNLTGAEGLNCPSRNVTFFAGTLLSVFLCCLITCRLSVRNCVLPVALLCNKFPVQV